VFDRNEDDGLYGEDDASFFVTNSLLLHNSPYAVRVVGNARAWVGHSIAFGNAAKSSEPEGKQSIHWGKQVCERDPQVKVDYSLRQPPLGDPDVRGPRGNPTTVGLSEVAACTSLL
jgi:hypothetical protein